MRLLAVDTATGRVGVALWGEDGLLASWSAAGGRRHGEILAPAVRDLLASASCSVGDLTAVAVDLGPGLFTGLRVGVATVKALAAALGVPAVGLTSLEVLAHPHRRQPAVVAAVVDARRHEVFRSLHRPVDGALVALGDPAVMTPAALAEELAGLGGAVLAVGDGATRYADVLSATAAGSRSVRIEIGGPLEAHPDAAVLAELAVAALAAGRGTDAAGLQPRYMRQADVRIGWDERAVPAPPAAAPGAAR